MRDRGYFLWKRLTAFYEPIMIDLANISFDHCIKCTVCTAYCPVARATAAYPGPKQSGPDTERLRIKNPNLLDASLHYCNNCKRCEIACPSDVKIADIIQSAKWKYAGRSFRPRDFILSRTDLSGVFGTRFSSLFNMITGLWISRWLLKRILNVTDQRALPRYEKRSFHHRHRHLAVRESSFREHVVYFTGCYVNYNDHKLGEDLIRLLHAMNIGVTLTREKCCGVPLIANGYIDKARRNARHNIRVLGAAVRNTDMRIVSTSSTCTYALTNEYPNLLELDDGSIAGRVEYISRYLYQRFEQGRMPALKPLNQTVAYHAPCHLERMGGVLHTVAILRKIPGLNIRMLHSECCGIAGTYGFKEEYYRIAQDVGADLFQRIESVDPDIVVTDCETCKWQIESSTSREVLHPVTLLARALR